MRGKQARRLRAEAITRYDDGERLVTSSDESYVGLYRAIKRRWTRLKRVG